MPGNGLHEHGADIASPRGSALIHSSISQAPGLRRPRGSQGNGMHLMFAMKSIEAVLEGSTLIYFEVIGMGILY